MQASTTLVSEGEANKLKNAQPDTTRKNLKNAQHRTQSGRRTHSRYSAHGHSSGESLIALRRVERAVGVLGDGSRLPREVAGRRLGELSSSLVFFFEYRFP